MRQARRLWSGGIMSKVCGEGREAIMAGEIAEGIRPGWGQMKVATVSLNAPLQLSLRKYDQELT